MKPSNFTNYPFSSVLQKSESETVARNIMIILARNGDRFRKLGWREYKLERQKDGGFYDIEKIYFNEVADFCKTEKKAMSFSNEWKH